MNEFFTLILLFFGVMLLARFITAITIKSQQDGSRPVNPNMTEPCPPHAWQPPKQKGLGIVYQCEKCGQIYPSTADPRQR